MAQALMLARRTIIVLLMTVGAYYAFLGASVLVRLGDVTRRWIQLSGDPDFQADAGLFGVLIGVGGAVWVLLGVWTIVSGVRTLTGRQADRARWTLLTIATIVSHVPWLLYKVIGTGDLPPAEATRQIEAAVFQLEVVVLIYIVAWVATRRWPARRPQPRGIGNPNTT